jgi:hypothetical protein
VQPFFNSHHFKALRDGFLQMTALVYERHLLELKTTLASCASTKENKIRTAVYQARRCSGPIPLDRMHVATKPKDLR